MKVLAVIALFALALVFLLAPVHFLITRGWGRRRGAWYWLLWAGLAVDTGFGHSWLLCISPKVRPLSQSRERGLIVHFWEGEPLLIVF